MDNKEAEKALKQINELLQVHQGSFRSFTNAMYDMARTNKISFSETVEFVFGPPTKTVNTDTNLRFENGFVTTGPSYAEMLEQGGWRS